MKLGFMWFVFFFAFLLLLLIGLKRSRKTGHRTARHWHSTRLVPWVVNDPAGFNVWHKQLDLPNAQTADEVRLSFETNSEVPAA